MAISSPGRVFFFGCTLAKLCDPFACGPPAVFSRRRETGSSRGGALRREYKPRPRPAQDAGAVGSWQSTRERGGARPHGVRESETRSPRRGRDRRDWGIWRPLLALLLEPPARGELGDQARRVGGDPLDHVLEVGGGVDPELFAACHEGVEEGRALSASGAASEGPAPRVRSAGAGREVIVDPGKARGAPAMRAS